MRRKGLLTRILGALARVDPDRPSATAPADMSLLQRLLHAFARTPEFPSPAAGPATSAPSRHSPVRPRTAADASRWFSLPPLLAPSTLGAAGDPIIMEAASPGGAARFLVRRGAGEYRLEIVIDDDVDLPLVCEIRYLGPDGHDRTLLVPVARVSSARFGPPSSSVRLPELSDNAEATWSARVTSIPARPDWSTETIAFSVHAALSAATRQAWRVLRDGMGEGPARDAIDLELP